MANPPPAPSLGEGVLKRTLGSGEGEDMCRGEAGFAEEGEAGALGWGRGLRGEGEEGAQGGEGLELGRAELLEEGAVFG